MTPITAVAAFNEFWINAYVEMMTAMTFPAVYMAKGL